MIFLIFTSCIHNTRGGRVDYEARKQRYITCINIAVEILKDYPQIKPIIVENSGLSESYLDELNCDVVYTNNNSVDTKEKKGMNEMLDIQYVIEKYNIQDDDFVIKLTGRYRMRDNTFLEKVINSINEYDIFMRFYNVCTRKKTKFDCVLGYFAVKSKYLKGFKYKGKRSAEIEFAGHIRNNINEEKICDVDDLRIECCFAEGNRIQKV